MKSFFKKSIVLLVLIVIIAASSQVRAVTARETATEITEKDQPSVALVLSSGAAWGLAHIGVIEALEEHNIEVDIITGTSAGAIIGSLYADGLTTAEMIEEIADLGWTDFLFPSLNNKGLGIFTTNRIENHLQKLYQAEKIEELSKKVAFTTTDIDTGSAVVFTEGPLAKVVSASAAVPVLFDPVEIDGYWLADGGLVSNLPVEEAKKLGADVIIAVDVATGFSFTGRPESRIEYGNRAYNILRGALQRPDGYDILIEPDLNDLQGFDFDAYEEIIARGREAAEDMMAEIEEKINSSTP